MNEDRKRRMGIVKSYDNIDFLNSPPARIIRILAEMIEPDARFRKYGIRDTVVFFGSARTMSRQEATTNLKKVEAQIKRTKAPSRVLKHKYELAKRAFDMSRYYEDAARLSEKLTRHFMTLSGRDRNFMVCSGGGPGIMAAASLGAKRAGGKSIGLNISLPIEQFPNPHQTRELSFEFHYFFIRKFWFFYLAKALIVFPGGFGTMDELFELLTLMQTGKAKKHMAVVLYGSEYWNSIINFDKMLEWGTISRRDRKLFRIVDDVDEAFKYLKNELERHSFKGAYGPQPLT